MGVIEVFLSNNYLLNLHNREKPSNIIFVVNGICAPEVKLLKMCQCKTISNSLLSTPSPDSNRQKSAKQANFANKTDRPVVQSWEAVGAVGSVAVFILCPLSSLQPKFI